MINGMYLSTMGAMVQASRHEVITNNLANADTGGFKPEWTIFKELPAESLLQAGRRSEIDPILERTGGGVWLDETPTDFRMGALNVTGNPLDLALRDVEPGYTSFFAIQPAGAEEEHYTRAGHFIRNGNGQLVNPDGYAVLNAGGDPVEIPPETRQVRVREDGVLLDVDSGAILDQIKIVRTDDANRMTKIGANLYTAGEAQLAANQAGVVDETLETSGTSAITEMANMIEAHRTYELNMTFLRAQDETLGQVVSRLGSVA